ncbi:hypothetical protein HOBO_230 [Bacillus phage Hobo]|uniref:Uncharacterized protein n=2 Tax=Caeruleovirus BM15 TaxID=1985178 RepID=A0A0S2MUS1_9CAUD|nr:hypothetical protein FD732_gp111 [Bacillus phage BM15]ALO79638.1 hypothetical protein BM10_234 [Bacillus phage BM15]AXQ66985.1 hypothetical protein HOBO_230 [Bacillus phage Hobo]
MKQHLTATYVFDPLDVVEFNKVCSKVEKLKDAGYVEKVRNMNKEGQVIIKLEFEEEM